MKHVATTLIGALTLYANSLPGLAAAPADDLRRQVVRFADLDLTRPAGAQELYRRIQHAAREVCSAYGPRSYDVACAHRSIAQAVADVGAPLLTARWERQVDGRTLQVQQARLVR